MRDTFLFDLDGTLVTMELDFAQIRKEVDHILVDKGYPQELLDYKKSVLETIDSAVTYLQENGLTWKELKKEVDTYLEKTELEAASRAVLLEGAKDILVTLKEKKKKVGIITRNNRRVALNVLKKSGLSPYVDIVLARDDVDNVKPHPDHVVKAVEKLDSTPECTVVLGDHHFEIEAGNKAGCYTVGFLTGSGTKETLKNADIILNSIKDLKGILDSLFIS
ncbi:MAG: HAD family hydrolase [Theionarchaea archaeon]|nr:HAD family hydrolase [Theionarchaea archaeon]